MKRFVFLLLTAWLLSSGFAVADVNLRGYAKENGYQYLAFGCFPQTADGEEQPILWRILSATDKEAYLLSEYILFNNRVHPDDDAYRASGGAFNQTEIYALLNGPFERIVISPEEEAELRHKTYYGRAYAAETSFYEQAFTAAEKAMILDDKELGRRLSAVRRRFEKRGLRLWHESIHKSLWHAICNRRGTVSLFKRFQPVLDAHTIR